MQAQLGALFDSTGPFGDGQTASCSALVAKLRELASDVGKVAGSRGGLDSLRHVAERGSDAAALAQRLPGAFAAPSDDGAVMALAASACTLLTLGSTILTCVEENGREAGGSGSSGSSSSLGRGAAGSGTGVGEQRRASRSLGGRLVCTLLSAAAGLAAAVAHPLGALAHALLCRRGEPPQALTVAEVAGLLSWPLAALAAGTTVLLTASSAVLGAGGVLARQAPLAAAASAAEPAGGEPPQAAVLAGGVATRGSSRAAELQAELESAAASLAPSPCPSLEDEGPARLPPHPAPVKQLLSDLSRMLVQLLQVLTVQSHREPAACAAAIEELQRAAPALLLCLAQSAERLEMPEEDGFQPGLWSSVIEALGMLASSNATRAATQAALAATGPAGKLGTRLVACLLAFLSQLGKNGPPAAAACPAAAAAAVAWRSLGCAASSERALGQGEEAYWVLRCWVLASNVLCMPPLAPSLHPVLGNSAASLALLYAMATALTALQPQQGQGPAGPAVVGQAQQEEARQQQQQQQGSAPASGAAEQEQPVQAAVPAAAGGSLGAEAFAPGQAPAQAPLPPAQAEAQLAVVAAVCNVMGLALVANEQSFAGMAEALHPDAAHVPEDRVVEGMVRAQATAAGQTTWVAARALHSAAGLVSGAAQAAGEEGRRRTDAVALLGMLTQNAGLILLQLRQLGFPLWSQPLVELLPAAFEAAMRCFGQLIALPHPPGSAATLGNCMHSSCHAASCALLYVHSWGQVLQPDLTPAAAASLMALLASLASTTCKLAVMHGRVMDVMRMQQPGAYVPLAQQSLGGQLLTTLWRCEEMAGMAMRRTAGPPSDKAKGLLLATRLLRSEAACRLLPHADAALAEHWEWRGGAASIDRLAQQEAEEAAASTRALGMAGRCTFMGCSALAGASDAEVRTKRCSECCVARYCCSAHQKLDWRRHKPQCAGLAADRLAAKLVAAAVAAAVRRANQEEEGEASEEEEESEDDEGDTAKGTEEEEEVGASEEEEEEEEEEEGEEEAGELGNAAVAVVAAAPCVGGPA